MLESTRILGVPVTILNLGSAVQEIMSWIENDKANYICVRDVHGVMRSIKDPELMKIQEGAGLVTPDGMPLVWIGRLRGFSGMSRVCGYDLVDAVCSATNATEVRHYFYGGKPGVAEVMVENLRKKYPLLKIAGIFCPPFRPLTAEEDDAAIREIGASGADIVWVGISTPAQEFWMRDHVGRIAGATLVGVGAAFDFHAGTITRAPKWVQNAGLEWLFRFLSEPRRLWRRYLVMAPAFLIALAVEAAKTRLAKLNPNRV